MTPALAAYITRIGAEELNFKRYMIKEHRGAYYIERVLIKISDEGDVECRSAEHQPTEEEAADIKREWSKAIWPKNIKARSAVDLEGRIQPNSVVFEFRDWSGTDDLIMVQERTESKVFLSWTFWDDGKWRMMEPEGALPFWRPRPTDKPRIMIHEGAKAAAFADSISRGLVAHPWSDELVDYEHWGMIGGALAPHRTDYTSLRTRKPVDVVYVCDNDFPGKSALQKVSKEYGGKLRGVKFNNQFKESWDIADPMPAIFFQKDGRYTGPRLEDLMEPATFATASIPRETGRPAVVLSDIFKQEWAHCVSPEVFVHMDQPWMQLAAPEFNNKVAPYSDADDTARLIKKDGAGKSIRMLYSPDMKPGFVSKEGVRCINTHMPSSVVAERGDPGPWLKFLEHLVPEDCDRLELMRWVATLVARPDTKMLYGVLLISETQGVGKGTLGEKILTPLVGVLNTSFPSESEVVESQFNGWAAHKRLAVVHEIYAGQSTKAYNKLKSIITDQYITVNKKFQTTYEIDNWLHIFACSNSARALKLSYDDRRWFVPRITDNKQDAGYWRGFNEWLNNAGGLGIIKWWAEEWLNENRAVQKGDSAPYSTLKKEVVEEGMSAGQLLVAGFLEEMMLQANESGSPVIFTDAGLVELIKDVIYEGRINDRLEKPLTVRKIAKSQGWTVSKKRAFVKEWGTRMTGPWLLCSDPGDASRAPGDLAKEGKKPSNPTEIFNKNKML